MVIIDEVQMNMPHAFVTMRMAVWFGSLPTLVFVIMMNIVNMFVLMVHRRVGMRQGRFIALGPKDGCQGRKRNRQQAENPCRGFNADVRTELTGQKIENQPASMRQGKLGGKISGAIRLCRSARIPSMEWSRLHLALGYPSRPAT